MTIGAHYDEPGAPGIHYKYTVIVCHDGKLCVEDPEIIVDPDPHPDTPPEAGRKRSR